MGNFENLYPRLRLRANFKTTAKGEIQPDVTVEISDVSQGELEDFNELLEKELIELHNRVIKVGKELGYKKQGEA